jgi:hypothetical protein
MDDEDFKTASQGSDEGKYTLEQKKIQDVLERHKI